MGTNTMVAAVGLVIGPVLGGALVTDLLALGVLVQRAVRALGSAWALGGAARAHAVARATPHFDVLGTMTFLIGLTGLVFGISKGGLSGLERPARDRRTDRRGACSCRCSCWSRAVSARRCSISRSSRTGCSRCAAAAAFLNGLARFALMFLFVFYFQGVQGDSPVLAGHEARAARGRDADRVAAGRASRPIGAARGRWPRSGCSSRRSASALMTTLERDTLILGARRASCSSSASARACSTRRTRAAMMGTVAAAPARNRVRRPDPRAEHRRGDVDRVRAGDRDLVGARRHVLFAVFSGLAKGISTSS